MSDGNKETIYHKIDYLDIKILDCIYNKEITVLRNIRERLKGVATRKTISKRIKILSKMNLFIIVKDTNPLCIDRLIDDDKIKVFINQEKIKRGLI